KPVGTYTADSQSGEKKTEKTYTACTGLLKFLRVGVISSANQDIIITENCKVPFWVKVYERRKTHVAQDVVPGYTPLHPSGIIYPSSPVMLPGMESPSYGIPPSQGTVFPGSVVTGPFSISMKQVYYLTIAEVKVQEEGNTKFSKRSGYLDVADFGHFYSQDTSTGFVKSYLIPLPCLGFLTSVYEGAVFPGYTVAQIICNLKDLNIR
ncbi:putative signal peptide-containing protein, partial [Cryptosporidium canis]